MGVITVEVGRTAVAAGVGTGVARNEHEVNRRVSARKNILIRNIIVFSGL